MMEHYASIKMEIPSEKKRKMLVLLECVHLLIFGGATSRRKPTETHYRMKGYRLIWPISESQYT